ncbi:MAG: hypothetical protein K8R53_01230 [Bacteroidales bacterium]|nr:hypothetical protein [Bacteroidales bacterium]
MPAIPAPGIYSLQLNHQVYLTTACRFQLQAPTLKLSDRERLRKLLHQRAGGGDTDFIDGLFNKNLLCFSESRSG